MAREPHLLGIDVGTEGTKVALFDINGRVVKDAYEEYELICPRAGWAEQDPEKWWHAVSKNVKVVLASSGLAVDDVRGVGVCGQMHAPVPIDKDGNLLYRSPSLWCDKRNAPQCEKLKSAVDEEQLIKISANPITTPWTGIKIMWMKENAFEIYRKAYKFLVPKDYIVYKLTGEVSIDWSEASGTFLFDAEKEKWSDELAGALGIDLEKLPSIYASHQVVGEITSEAEKTTGLRSGTPVVSGGGDFLCTLLGAGVVSEDRAADISGTASIVAFYSKKPLIDRRIMNLHHVVPGWIPFGIVEGGLLRWFKDEFGKSEREEAAKRGLSPYKIMDEEAAKIPAGSDGLVLIPYFIGERTMGSPYARGVFFGLTLAHRRAHLIRAIMEGITYASMQSVEVVRQLGLRPDSFRLIGGGAVSPLWRQIKADIYGLQTQVLSTYQGGVLGAAILAGVGAGAFKDASSVANEMVSIVESCNPIEKNCETYHKLYKVYVQLHDSVQVLYDELAKIQM